MRIMLPIFLATALLTSVLARQTTQRPTYEVFAISYAVIPDFAVANLVAGADRSRKIDIQMMVWLLKGSNGSNILVDTGFYRDKFFKQWKVKDFIKPSEAIAKAGLKPEDISDVIITHMHWDHADGMDLFPKARVWIQNDEYVYYTGEAWQSKGSHGGIEPEDVMTLVRLNTEGRVRLVKGDDQEAIEGIRFTPAGGTLTLRST